MNGCCHDRYNLAHIQQRLGVLKLVTNDLDLGTSLQIEEEI